MTPSPEISAFFREMQRKGVESKLKTTTAQDRKDHAIKMNKIRWDKAKKISRINSAVGKQK